MPKHLILIVDDDSAIRSTLKFLLADAGYEVNTAEHGFDALLQLKRTRPELIASDLNMPQMSGFEFLSVVRRRFPHIPVVAMSGAYGSCESVPGGVIADAFYAKGSGQPGLLLSKIADLIRTAPERIRAHHQESAPVWIPRNGRDSSGVPYVVLTCTECLRSFPLSVEANPEQRVEEVSCLFCTSAVRYIVDFSVSVISPRSQQLEPQYPQTGADLPAKAPRKAALKAPNADAGIESACHSGTQERAGLPSPLRNSEEKSA
jgi:CheY-like chemotaxis protein